MKQDVYVKAECMWELKPIKRILCDGQIQT